MRKLVVVVFVVSLALAAAGGDKPKPKAKGQVVDSGSFGIYVSGRRVATEKFEIVQRAEGSTASTELITDEAKAKPSQSTELQMSPNGDLLRYTWRDLESTKAQAVVEPNNEFLIEHATPTPQAKTEDTPFLMPHSTVILDDYAFIHREILAWRYLATGCAPNAAGKMECHLARTEFSVLIPQQRISAQVAMESGGREKITIRGVERELTRLNLQGEGYAWALWLDENNKLVRILVDTEKTEILRD